ncbi:MAG TPA: type 1 glutamine amidotransferase [Spirochaetota bacterium]|nr:type 1 glutamine amidotransferase [Spirochaetota bacterium]HRX49338.1 type 1 glutamine amidotransferase [Spirochaetota bacterium]
MKRIHVLQHVPFETPGCIIHWAEDMGYPVSATHLYRGDTLPDVNDVDLLVVMGGPMSVHDTDIYPWLNDEKRFIHSAVSSGKGVAGICLGSQLIAEVLGSSVRSNGEKEIGWHRIFRAEESPLNSLFDLIPDGIKVFHWHGETFDLPGGAVHGFSSECCRNQAFLYDGRVLGLQFHLEVTPHLLHEMIDNCRSELIPSDYVQEEGDILSGMNNIRENNNIMFSLLDKLDSAVITS